MGEETMMGRLEGLSRRKPRRGMEEESAMQEEGAPDTVDAILALCEQLKVDRPDVAAQVDEILPMIEALKNTGEQAQAAQAPAMEDTLESEMGM